MDRPSEMPATCEPRYAAWAKRRGYRPCTLSVCAHRLVKARCPRRHLFMEIGVCWPPETDHARMWRKADGGLVLSSEPYGIRDEGVELMTEYARAMGLKFRIGCYSPYWPGNTVLIEWQAK